MTQTPSGTVTILFTDLVDSSALRVRLGDDETERRRRDHFRLLRESVRAHRGVEVKTLGDGMMAAFSSALDALECAVTAQRAVHRGNLALDEPDRLLLSAGLDAGEAIREGDDYFGTSVVLAQRLSDAACRGQVLVSDLVRRLIGSRGAHTFRLVEPVAAKGFAEPVMAWEVLWEPGATAEHQTAPHEHEPLALPPPLAGERTPFVGRERELGALRELWRKAAGGRTVAFVCGEPGIGKTRLAAELAIDAHRAGAAVLYGRCDEQPLVPCQPLAEALQQAGIRDVLSASADAEPDRYRLVDTITSTLLEAAASSQVLLLLDDLQWADDATLQALRRIARHAATGRLMVLGIYRDTDVPRPHPLGATLADLRRERPFERIDVPRLEPTEVASLVRGWAGADAPEALSHVIFEQTDGNPLFVEEVLRHLTETDTIGDSGDTLSVDLSAVRLAIPQGVKDLIGQRLARLSERCNSVLAVASVIGREFDLDALERASGVPLAELLPLLEEAAAARLVSEAPQAVGRYRFAHNLVYEALYDELSATRRVYLHGQTLRYADNDGVKLAYEVLGVSGPFVVVAGASNGPSVRGRVRGVARRWDRLSRSCRLVFYDRRGVGLSSTPDRGYSMLASVEDLRAVIDDAGAERAIVWGATDGGPLAIAFAVHHPERTAALVLAGTTAKYLMSDDFPWGVDLETVEGFLRTDPVDRARAVTNLTSTRGAPYGTEEIAEVMRRVPPRAWSKLIAGIGAADARELLPRVRVPTLIIHDPQNSYIPVGSARYMHEQIAGSQIEISEEYGTGLWGDELFRRIERFIDRVGQGTS